MLLLPSRCGACSRTGPSPCRPCRAGLVLAPPLQAPAPLCALVALLAYEGDARRLVAGLKVRHNRAAQRWLAAGLALVMPPEVDLITWAPTSPDRAAARGADHARLLAEAVARAAGVRCHRSLGRRPGPQQTGRSRAERLADGPSFTALFDLSGLVVAVVDDVTTTGATLAAAGRALIAAGARSAAGIAAAATPPSPAGRRELGAPWGGLGLWAQEPLKDPAVHADFAEVPNGTWNGVHRRCELGDDLPAEVLSSGPRPAAVARGRYRVGRGPVAPELLAVAILQAHALLAGRSAPRLSQGWACGSVVESRCQSQAKRPT